MHPVVPLGVPTPIPTATFGDSVDSVTVTVPVCATVNVNRLAPCTASEPANVSVAFVGVGVVGDAGDVMSLSRLHPAPERTALNTTASATLKRRHESDMAMFIVVHRAQDTRLGATQLDLRASRFDRVGDDGAPIDALAFQQKFPRTDARHVHPLPVIVDSEDVPAVFAVVPRRGVDRVPPHGHDGFGR